jgi:hypothetical protein
MGALACVILFSVVRAILELRTLKDTTCRIVKEFISTEDVQWGKIILMNSPMI